MTIKVTRANEDGVTTNGPGDYDAATISWKTLYRAANQADADLAAAYKAVLADALKLYPTGISVKTGLRWDGSGDQMYYWLVEQVFAAGEVMPISERDASQTYRHGTPAFEIEWKKWSERGVNMARCV